MAYVVMAYVVMAYVKTQDGAGLRLFGGLRARVGMAYGLPNSRRPLISGRAGLVTCLNTCLSTRLTHASKQTSKRMQAHV